MGAMDGCFDCLGLAWFLCVEIIAAMVAKACFISPVDSAYSYDVCMQSASGTLVNFKRHGPPHG